MDLSRKQSDALRAVCDCFVPRIDRAGDADGFWSRTASDLGVHNRIVTLVGTLPKRERTDFLRLLDLLSTPGLGLTWRGPMKSFVDLNADDRQRMLQAWSTSKVGLLRKGYQSLKKLATFIFYSYAKPGAPNPNWASIQYPGPEWTPRPASQRIRPTRVDHDTVLQCDTVVVGSGAGGGVIAGELAAAGDDVIVVEKGPYLDEDEFSGYEAQMMARLYEMRASLTTVDGGLSVLAGSCLGGGTTVNWAGAFRTPEYVLRGWAERQEIPELLGPAFQASTDAVSRAIGVNTDESFHNAQNKALWDGAKKLGYHVAEIPKNTRGCTPDDASWYGFGGFGDASGTKQSTLKTYLRTAASHGARIMPDTTVETVIVSRGRAIGVEATQRDEEGNAFMVTIQARRVVVAAGALHTPALLMRSGVTHPHLGRHLYLHPTVSVAAFYPRPMDPWHGNMMTAVSNEFAKLDDGFGAKLETPPVHPGLLALALPWKSGEQHKELMLRARNLGAFIVLTRDRHGGRITTSRSGRPKVEYVLNPYDRKHLLAGIAGAARVHVASGAEEILFPHNQLPVYRTSDGEAELERMIAEMPKWGWKPNQVPLFSAHQMGTCRMGGTDAGHPVRPDGQVRGVRGLYVADASLFPEASGVNPMLTIMALAHYVAQGLKHTLPSGDGAAGRSDIEIKHPTSGIRTKDEG